MRITSQPRPPVLAQPYWLTVVTLNYSYFYLGKSQLACDRWLTQFIIHVILSGVLIGRETIASLKITAYE